MAPRPRPGPADRRTAARHARVLGRGRSTLIRRRRKAARHPGHRGRDAAPPGAARRRPRRLRHEPQGEPAAALGGASRRASGRALADGTIDAVATDHAPHAPEDKEQEFDQAPPGTIGLETALAVGAHRAGRARRHRPARGRAAAVDGPGRDPRAAEGHGGPIAAGCPANLAVFDPSAEWVVGDRPFGVHGVEQRVHGTPAPRPRHPYAAPRRVHRPGGRADQVSAAVVAPTPCSCWRMARRSGARGSAPRARRSAKRCSTPACPAIRRSSPTPRTRPDRDVHGSPHRELRREPRGRRVRGGAGRRPGRA